MKRSVFQISALLAVFSASGAGGASAAAAPVPPELELVRPAPGEMLSAGSEAVLEWAAAAELPPELEEWEAFLSLNGGAFYAYRVTPHLDVSLRRVTFRVPALPTEDARFLLRFGDEAHEVAVQVPLSFSIRPSLVPAQLPRRLSQGRGESARPGESGVVAWVEGSRRGAGLVQVEAPGTAGLRPVVAAGLLKMHLLAPPRSPHAAGTPVRLALLAGELPPERPPPVLTAAAPSPILLLGCRLNE